MQIVKQNLVSLMQLATYLLGKYDSGDEGDFGDEAETVVNMSYAVDGATIAAKGNDQDEVEVSVAFSF